MTYSTFIPKIVSLKESQKDKHSRDGRKFKKFGKGKIDKEGIHFRNSKYYIYNV